MEFPLNESRVFRSALLALVLTCSGSLALALEVKVSTPGVSGDLRHDLRDASLSAGLVEDKTATAQDILAAARADYTRMVARLFEKGHYGGIVSIRVDGREVADISPLSGPERISNVHIVVDPGPEFTFSRATLAPLPAGVVPPEGYHAGAPARSRWVIRAAETGVDSWRRAGHAKVVIADQRIMADHRDHTIAADIVIAPGPRLSFGDLNVVRDGGVHPERVRAIAGLPVGEVYSPETLQKSATRLRRTGAFRSVLLQEAEEIGPNDTLDINARLEAAKPRRIGVGAEIASLEGLSLSGFWMHRNLLGGGERLRFDAEISGIGGDTGGTDYLLSTRFDRPATFTPDTGLFFEARLEQNEEPDYRERLGRIEGGLTHIFNEHLTGEIGLAYQFTDIRDALGSRQLEHLGLPVRLTYDIRDDRLDARSGIYADVELAPFVGINGDSGARLYSDLRGYYGLGAEKRIVLAGRTQIGSVMNAQATEVPPGMLFFSGGAGSVRGQPYQDLGIDVGGGKQIGGRSFMAFSGEVRADVGDKWQAVGFADAGFVGEDSWGSANGEWHSGAGLGVRYKTGLGPIRFDIATPTDGDAGKKFEFYIGIGQAF